MVHANCRRRGGGRARRVAPRRSRPMMPVATLPVGKLDGCGGSVESVDEGVRSERLVTRARRSLATGAIGWVHLVCSPSEWPPRRPTPARCRSRGRDAGEETRGCSRYSEVRQHPESVASPSRLGEMSRSRLGGGSEHTPGDPCAETAEQEEEQQDQLVD